MSSRLVAVTDELSKLAEDCDEPARGDEPYRRALRVIHARLTATAAQILDEQPDNLLDLGLPPYATPGEMLADLDTVDASLRAHGSTLLADDRLARLREAVRRLRFSPVRPGHAAELRRPRRGGRRVARLVRRASRLLLAERRRTGQHPGRRAEHPAAAGRRPRATVGLGSQRTRDHHRRRTCCRHLRSTRGAQLHHLDVSLRLRSARGRASC